MLLVIIYKNLGIIDIYVTLRHLLDRLKVRMKN